MAMDVFANGVYGVLLPPVLAKQLSDALAAVLEEAEEAADPENDWWDLPVDARVYRALEVLKKENKSLLAGIRKRMKAPPGLDFVYTGSADARVGRCNADPGTWVYGIGMMHEALFETVVGLPGAFRKRCEWHTWVEG